jgi:hypothetical protein
MIFAYDLTGAEPIIRDYPIYGGAADILEGAVVIRGATPGTDGSQLITGAATACADVVGVLNELHDYSVSGDSAIAGTTWVLRKVIINPFAVYRAEYSTGAIAVASTSTTTVTVSSLEDNIDGGWLLGDDGLLEFLTASAAGSCTSKTASGWTSANTLQKILPLFHQLGVIATGGANLNHAAAAGTATISVLENWIQAKGIPRQRLDPTKHSGLTLTSAKIYSDIVFRNHAFNTID